VGGSGGDIKNDLKFFDSADNNTLNEEEIDDESRYKSTFGLTGFNRGI
jgi:hypothetical protein